MSSYYDEETQWIKTHAQHLSDKYDVHYYSVLYAGLDAYQAGLAVDQIKTEMQKVIRWNRHETGQPAPAVTV